MGEYYHWFVITGYPAGWKYGIGQIVSVNLDLTQVEGDDEEGIQALLQPYYDALAAKWNVTFERYERRMIKNHVA